MWPFSEPLNDFFEELKRKRKEGMDEDGDEVVPMSANEDPRLKKLREG